MTTVLELWPYLPEIVRTIFENDITFLSAPTGAGKSIVTPIGIAALGARVAVAIPTKNSVIELMNSVRYFTSMRGVINPEEYTAGAFDAKVTYTDNTKIIYATSRHLRNLIIREFRKGRIDFCDVLFIDEVHNFTNDVAVLLTAWKEAYKRGMLVPRLLVSSATPVDVLDGLDVAYFVVQGERKYPTYVRYLERDIPLSDPKFNLTMVELVKEIHTKTEIDDSPHILVFLASAGDIDAVYKLIPDYEDAIKLKLSGASTPEESAAASRLEFGNKRKIVLSTNVSETGITIPRLGYVVDSLLEFRQFMIPSGSVQLQVTRISKDSAIQRAGRTGRKNEGIIFRMITKKDFDNLHQHIPRETDTLPIYEPILEFVSAGIDPYAFPADPEKIRTSLELLTSLDIVITDPSNNKPIISEIGDFVVSYPLPIRLATFLYHWIRLGLPLFQGCAICSMITLWGKYFTQAKKDPSLSKIQKAKIDEEHKETYYYKYQAENTYDLMINVFIDLYENTDGFRENITSYCIDNALNAKEISKMIQAFQQCFRKKVPDISGLDPLQIDRSINLNFSKFERFARSLLYAVHRTEILTHQKGKNYINRLGDVYTLYENELIQKRTVFDKNLVGLILSEIRGKDGKVNRSVSLSFPITL